MGGVETTRGDWQPWKPINSWVSETARRERGAGMQVRSLGRDGRKVEAVAEPGTRKAGNSEGEMNRAYGPRGVGWPQVEAPSGRGFVEPGALGICSLMLWRPGIFLGGGAVENVCEWRFLLGMGKRTLMSHSLPPPHHLQAPGEPWNGRRGSPAARWATRKEEIRHTTGRGRGPSCWGRTGRWGTAGRPGRGVVEEGGREGRVGLQCGLGDIGARVTAAF